MQTATAGETFVMVRFSTLKWFWVYLLIGVMFGCSDSTPLERTQARQKVTLSGTFLTESPDEITFPVKVLFALDCSLSMGMWAEGQFTGSDPNFLRFDAVQNFIEEYNDNENVSFAVMLWSADVFMVTQNGNGEDGFTKDPDELNQVLNYRNNDTTTDYLGTLDAIDNIIQADIQAEENRDNLIRTQYLVVFLSDGTSDDGTSFQDDNDIWNKVEDTYAWTMDAGVGTMSFHTFMLMGGYDDSPMGIYFRDHAVNTLTGMAQRGNGQFHEMENAEAIDFINVIDMRLTVEYRIKYMVAFNYNVRPGLEVAQLDSDGDGLPDEEELVFGTNPDVADTDGDGMSDLLEIRETTPQHPIDPNTPDSPCTEQPDSAVWPDTDMDGLNDCAELVNGTQRLLPDTDRDGIPDGIEFEMETFIKEDLEYRDADLDGCSDWLEVQQHTNVRSSDPIYRSRYAYQYSLQHIGLVEINQGTEMASYVHEYEFEISNIDVMETSGYSVDGTVYRQPGDNVIRLYIAQVPEDTPDMMPLYRMAEVTINTETSDRQVVLTPGDFQLIQ
jgi:hypothetical protein